MASKKRSEPRALGPDSEELSQILGELSYARSFIEITYALLEDNGGDATVCLEHGIGLLKGAYRKLDAAISRMPCGAD